MDEQIILVPVYPPPSYILDLFPSKVDSGFDHYSKLATLLSTPTSYITLSPPIPLPSSIFDASSKIPEIKGAIVCIDFGIKAAYISLHPTTKYDLSSAYESFLQSYPNRYVPAHIRETWRARFWRNMDSVQWVVNANILSAIDPGSGYCDLEHCFVPRGYGGGPRVVSTDGKFELAAGVLEVLTTITAQIKQLFAPALDEKRNIWQIPYIVEEEKKSKFRIREEFRLDEGIFEIGGGRKMGAPLNQQADSEHIERSGVGPQTTIQPMLTTKSQKRARASSNTQHRPVQLQIIENETGGKTAIRKTHSNALRLCHTIEGQAYIGVTRQSLTMRRIPPPPPSPHPPSLPHSPPPPPSLLSGQPESYPTPPADLSLPLSHPVIQPLHIPDQDTCRPSAPFSLPSPILSNAEDECDYKDKATE
ncbi:hypothetical protein K440DRAFT_45377 [Wilcoxina mikolae CBS 423.85]|nr:hypothetical protein K440DRAFT_45377 [Wilcoxina mikolae CBS 423.85]